MTVVSHPSFNEMLYAILKEHIKTNPDEVKSFKLYLDTVLINIPTKLEKYKPSVYFDNPSYKDVEYRGLTIPFFVDQASEKIVILGVFIT